MLLLSTWIMVTLSQPTPDPRSSPYRAHCGLCHRSYLSFLLTTLRASPLQGTLQVEHSHRSSHFQPLPTAHRLYSPPTPNAWIAPSGPSCKLHTYCFLSWKCSFHFPVRKTLRLTKLGTTSLTPLGKSNYIHCWNPQVGEHIPLQYESKCILLPSPEVPGQGSPPIYIFTPTPMSGARHGGPSQRMTNQWLEGKLRHFWLWCLPASLAFPSGCLPFSAI